MVFPKARLVVSAALFLGWIGFLAYLVITTRDPVILSRPQLLAADVVVVGEVGQAEGRPASLVHVAKVIWPAADAKLAGNQITVEGLPDCGPEQGWEGPGRYILPLTKRKSDYEIAAIPASPGYPHSPPRYVTVELTNEGTDPEKIARLVARLAGKNAVPKKGTLRRNVPWAEADDFKRELEAAKGGARLRDEETRIYRANDDAREQLEELKSAKESGTGTR